METEMHKLVRLIIKSVAKITDRFLRYLGIQLPETPLELVATVMVLTIIVSSALLKDFITGAYRSGAAYKELRWIETHPFIASAVLTVFAFVIGALTALWKQIRQGTYGIAEILFGACLAFNFAIGMVSQPSAVQLFKLGTSVYVIARGFNNLIESRGKESATVLVAAGAGR